MANDTMYSLRRKKILALGVVLIIMTLFYLRTFAKTSCSYFGPMCEDSGPKFPDLNSLRFVIYDALDYFESLAFLDNPPVGWSVIVINVNSSSQMDSCGQCNFVLDSWAENFLKDVGLTGLSKPLKVKMATYLFIQTSVGAEWIYVTNKAREVPYRALSRVVDKKSETGPVFMGPGDVFEPCHHFVDPITWYGKNSSIGSRNQYILRGITRPSVYSVVDECFHPDVTEEQWTISLDQRAPIPFVMAGRFGALDFNSILVSHDAMWTLIATVSELTSQNSDVQISTIKLNMAVQRVIWETNKQIGFLPGVPRRKACSVCAITSGIQALGKNFREDLSNWSCHPSKSVILCLKELVGSFDQDVKIASVIDAWLRFLDKAGIEQPERLILTIEKVQASSLGRRVLFSPTKLLRQESGNDDSYPPNVFKQICKKDGQPYRAIIPDTFKRSDVLLIITFNVVKFVSNIPLLEYLYGRFFSHIVYCSDSITSFENYYQNKYPNNPVSFITMPHVFNIEICTTTAMQMNYDVIGYLQFSDDVLVNLWNYHNLPMEQPWFQSFVGVGRLTDKRLRPGNRGVNHFTTWDLAREPMNLAWKHLQVISKGPAHDMNVERVRNFLEKSADGTNCPNCIYFSNADIFYIPQHLAEEFVFFAEFLSTYNVHFEVAIINVIRGLATAQNIHSLTGSYIWEEDRKRYSDLYNEKDEFYHPWKFSELRTPDGPKFFCERFLHNLDHDLIHWSGEWTRIQEVKQDLLYNRA